MAITVSPGHPAPPSRGALEPGQVNDLVFRSSQEMLTHWICKQEHPWGLVPHTERSSPALPFHHSAALGKQPGLQESQFPHL